MGRTACVLGYTTLQFMSRFGDDLFFGQQIRSQKEETPKWHPPL